MTVRTAIEGEQPTGPSPCWCCGTIEDRPSWCTWVTTPRSRSAPAARTHEQMRLGDRGRARTGFDVRPRDRFRRLRTTVVRRGWHHDKVWAAGCAGSVGSPPEQRTPQAFDVRHNRQAALRRVHIEKVFFWTQK
jgi:hypothetical protein